VRLQVARIVDEEEAIGLWQDGIAAIGDQFARAIGRGTVEWRRRRTQARRVGELFPGCAVLEQQAFAEHACRKYSGRVGRSAAAKALEADAVDLAVRATSGTYTRATTVCFREESRETKLARRSQTAKSTGGTCGGAAREE